MVSNLHAQHVNSELIETDKMNIAKRYLFLSLFQPGKCEAFFQVWKTFGVYFSLYYFGPSDQSNK